MHVLNVHARPGRTSLKKRRMEQEQDPLLGPPQGSSAGGTLPLLYSIKTHLAHQLPHPAHIPYEADEEKKRKDARIVVYSLSASNCIEKEPPSRT